MIALSQHVMAPAFGSLASRQVMRIPRRIGNGPLFGTRFSLPSKGTGEQAGTDAALSGEIWTGKRPIVGRIVETIMTDEPAVTESKESDDLGQCRAMTGLRQVDANRVLCMSGGSQPTTIELS
jgi:hypothetical protein